MEEFKNIIQTAIEYHKTGDFQNAEKFYIEFLKKCPNEAKAHHLLGAMYLQTKNYTGAKKSLEIAFSLENSLPVEIDLSLCYIELKEYNSAFRHLKNIITEQNSKLLYEKIIECTKALNLPNETLKYQLKLLEFDKNNIYLLREIAALAQDLEDFKTAEKYLNELIKICPDDFIALNNLGLIYEFTSRFDKAEQAYRQALSIKANADAAYNLSVLLKRMQRYNEAVEMIELAKNLNNGVSKYDYTLSTLYLAQKNFNAGYKMYADFLRTKQSENIKIWWNGTENKNAVLAICATEGYGDIIMFSRYLNYIDTNKFKDTVLIVPEALYELYCNNFPQFKIVKMGTSVEYNFATTLIELPLVYNLDFNHIPYIEGYLKPLTAEAEKWKKYFQKYDKNIGVFFSGNTSNKRTLHNRNIEFELLKPLLDIDNIKYFSLQPEKHFKNLFLGQNITDLSDKINNFSDTAAIISNLDIIITIDSSVAHLAGALGKKTFLMLPYSADWRWFNDNDTTPWYNSVKIFRQKTEGDWPSVIDNIVKSL